MNITSMGNIGSIKRYFHKFSFQNWILFHLMKLFLRGFFVLSDILKPAFEKSSKENS